MDAEDIYNIAEQFVPLILLKKKQCDIMIVNWVRGVLFYNPSS